MRRAQYLFFATLICCLSIYGVFYWQIDSKFSLIFGDDLDTVIQATLVSHWYGVLKQHRLWNSPLYFYPHADVLGYNDGYFLNGMFASAYRLIGINYLVSNELCLIAFRAVGFFSMATLLKRFSSRIFITLAGAALFTLAINVTNQAGHGQLFSISFIPLLAILLLNTFDAVTAEKKLYAFLWASAFFLLVDSVLMTSFYMAWFFGLFLIIFCLAKVAVDYPAVKFFVLRALSLKAAIAAATLTFIIALIPFLYVYLPTLKETGGHDYAGQLLYSLHPRDILNTGNTSIIWGDLFNSISNRFGVVFRDGEYRVGYTPDILLLILFIILTIIFRYSLFSKTFVALTVTTSVALLLPVASHQHSLWYFANHLVPGAEGVRVIARLYLFLTFPIAILITIFVDRLIDNIPTSKVIMTLVMIFLCLSQIRHEPAIRLDTISQLSHLSAVPSPPGTCKSFFTFNPALRDNAVNRKYRQNVDAMVIADHFNIPTLNGVASFEPQDWIFTDSPNYIQNVALYIEANRLHDVCSFNLLANKWELADPVKMLQGSPKYLMGTKVQFTTEESSPILAAGWSEPESWGTWSDGDSSRILLLPADAVSGDLKLTINARAFLTPKHNTLNVKVFVNEDQVGAINYGGSFPPSGAASFIIPSSVAKRRNGLLVVTLEYTNAIAPYLLGLNEDHRKLGIGILSLQLDNY